VADAALDRPFFPEHTGARVVALADVVKDHLDGRSHVKVAASRAYYGPDAGRQLAQSALDAVVIETPTYYHGGTGFGRGGSRQARVHGQACRGRCAGLQERAGQREEAQEKKLTYWVDFQTRSRRL